MRIRLAQQPMRQESQIINFDFFFQIQESFGEPEHVIPQTVILANSIDNFWVFELDPIGRALYTAIRIIVGIYVFRKVVLAAHF
jgi:hypothetical protein